MLQRFCDTLGGLWQLLRLGLITRFNFKGDYWMWRMHTAFGRGRPSRSEMIKAMLDYGRWMHQTRRFGRRW